MLTPYRVQSIDFLPIVGYVTILGAGRVIRFIDESAWNHEWLHTRQWYDRVRVKLDSY